ncbi:Tetratricopeptide repeat (TPR)-like superfamily protein [Raphanus sativus]|nr:Tetratricopeptide repeat (TPR)-like superfamily protein [Raphanus sativus]
MRDYFVYSTLLTSYTRSEKTLDKADATFEKMRELGFLLKPSPFNSMISLYGQLKNRDMVENLVREMQEKKVGFDSTTWNNVLRVYADPSKIKEMETFKTRVDEQGIKLEGSTVVAMARAYVKTRSVQKAIEMYGDVPRTQREVYSLWNNYKKEAKDDGYRTMMNSLLKLNNVEGAEKIFEEWNPEGTKLDMSVPRLLISRYYADGMEQKVDDMLRSIKKKRYGMHMKKLRYHRKRMFSNFTFRKMRWPYRTSLPDLTVLKKRLKDIGEFILCVAVLVAISGGYVHYIGSYDWLLEQHPPTTYHEVRLLNDSPMLYYLFYVRK